MPGDRWWRGFDDLITQVLRPRVLEIGCGDGSLVERLVELGLDVTGVDPNAPDRPRLIRGRVEDLELVPGEFDAIVSIMTLHHTDLESVLGAATRLLRPAGEFLAYEFAWECYDERAAAWVGSHDPQNDHSVGAWQAEHGTLHTAAAMEDALRDSFKLVSESELPYLARMLDRDDLRAEEAGLITADELPAVGRWYSASRV